MNLFGDYIPLLIYNGFINAHLMNIINNMLRITIKKS